MEFRKITYSILMLGMLHESLLAFNEETKEGVKVKVSSSLVDSLKRKLYKEGVETISYIGDMSYYIYGKKDGVENFIKNSKLIRSVNRDFLDQKVDNEIFKKGALDELSFNDSINLELLFFEEMDKSSLRKLFSDLNIDATVLSVNESLRSATIRVDKDAISKLKRSPKIEYIQKKVLLGSKNSKTREYHNVNSVSKDSGFHLEGGGLRVGIVDGGLVRDTHQEFVDSKGKSRVVDVGEYRYADHATHVAGIIGAHGVNPKAKGMAPDTNIYSFSFNDGSFGEMAVYIYNRYDILFSNHSYGYNDMMQLGKYDAEAVKQDRAVYQNPYLNIFEAAGNDGADAAYPAYGKIKGPANSKNILTIGALNINCAINAEFSSNGPVKDGRIKPDLCVRGEGIYSTFSQSDDDYMWMNGTSMATPAATGMALLLNQEYKRVTGGYDIRHDILKSALINSAIDKGRVGPDYDTGFGMINIEGAVKTISSLKSDSPRLFIDSVVEGEEKSYPFYFKNGGDFKATLVWVDPAGSPSASSSLVDDLDMVLVDERGNRYYPWSLDPSNPTQPAKQDRENHVDNIEQIVVKDLPSGRYTLKIKGSVVVKSRQDFAVSSNISINKENHIPKVLPSKIKNFAKTIQASLL